MIAKKQHGLFFFNKPKKAENNLAPADQDAPLPPDSFDEPPELLNADPDPSILTKIDKPQKVEELVEDTKGKSEEVQNFSEDVVKVQLN